MAVVWLQFVAIRACALTRQHHTHNHINEVVCVLLFCKLLQTKLFAFSFARIARASARWLLLPLSIGIEDPIKRCICVSNRLRLFNGIACRLPRRAAPPCALPVRPTCDGGAHASVYYGRWCCSVFQVDTWSFVRLFSEVLFLLFFFKYFFCVSCCCAAMVIWSWN